MNLQFLGRSNFFGLLRSPLLSFILFCNLFIIRFSYPVTLSKLRFIDSKWSTLLAWFIHLIYFFIDSWHFRHHLLTCVFLDQSILTMFLHLVIAKLVHSNMPFIFKAITRYPSCWKMSWIMAGIYTNLKVISWFSVTSLLLFFTKIHQFSLFFIQLSTYFDQKHKLYINKEYT